MSPGTRRALAVACALALARAAAAQHVPIEVNPNRPTFATPARTTQAGVAELEFGAQRASQRGGGSAFGTPTLLKLGVAADFEVRISSNGWLRLASPGAPAESGPADVALGVQWCYLRGGPLGFDQAVQLTHEFPTADAHAGLGTGAATDTLGLFASRDFGENHVDLNVLDTREGGTADGAGHRFVPAGTVSVSHNLSREWSFGGELYGIGGSAAVERVVSTLWYVAFKPLSRVVLDGGVDAGLSHGAPRYTLFAGLTWGIGRFYEPSPRRGP